MKIGCCVHAQEIETALQCGFDFVDLNGQELAAMPLGAVKELAGRMRGATCLGLHATVPAQIRLAGEDFALDRVKAYFDILAPRARLLGVRYLGIGSPAARRLPPGYPVQRADEQMRLALTAAAAAYPQGEILLESLNPGETNYINTLSHAARVIAGLDAARVGLVLDVYHLVLCGEGAQAITGEIAGRIRYMHIADVAGRRYPWRGTDPDLFALARAAARITGAEEIAIEAGEALRAREARAARDILAKAFEPHQGMEEA